MQLRTDVWSAASNATAYSGKICSIECNCIKRYDLLLLLHLQVHTEVWSTVSKKSKTSYRGMICIFQCNYIQGQSYDLLLQMQLHCAYRGMVVSITFNCILGYYV